MAVDAALVLMPEAPVNLNYLVRPCKHHVRSAGELVNVESVTETQAEYKPPHHHFRRRIPAADAPHVFASAMLRQPIQVSRSQSSFEFRPDRRGGKALRRHVPCQQECNAYPFPESP